MRLRILVAAALAGLVPAAGCSLLVSTSGLAGGDAPPDAATSDSANQLDATTTTDGSTDGPELKDGGVEAAGPFCGDAATTFCDDFERKGLPKDGWTGETIDPPGGMISLSNARGVSLPTSLLVTHPGRPQGSAEPTYVLLGRDFPLTATRMVLSFDIYIPRPSFSPSDVNMGITCFGIRTGGVRDGLCVSIAVDYIAVSTLGNSAAIKFDSWVHFTATVDHAGSPIATATIGDATFSGVPDRVSELGQADNIFVDLGLHAYNKPAPAVTAYYDNVTVDAR